MERRERGGASRQAAVMVGAVALAAAVGVFYYFQPELRRYLRMRRM